MHFSITEFTNGSRSHLWWFWVIVQGNSFEAGPASSPRTLQTSAITEKSLTPIKHTHTVFSNKFRQQDKQQPVCMKREQRSSYFACTHEPHLDIWKAYRSIIGLSPHKLQSNDGAGDLITADGKLWNKSNQKKLVSKTALGGLLFWPLQNTNTLQTSNIYFVSFVSYHSSRTFTKNNVYEW